MKNYHQRNILKILYDRHSSRFPHDTHPQVNTQTHDRSPRMGVDGETALCPTEPQPQIISPACGQRFPRGTSKHYYCPVHHLRFVWFATNCPAVYLLLLACTMLCFRIQHAGMALHFVQSPYVCLLIVPYLVRDHKACISPAGQISSTDTGCTGCRWAGRTVECEHTSTHIGAA